MTDVNTKRTTAIGANFEYIPNEAKRVTAIGANLEYIPASYARLTAIGIMLEYGPILVTPRVRGPALQIMN